MADSDGDNFGDKLEFDNGGNPSVNDNWRLAHIQNNPELFGLYTSNAVLDVALGQVAMVTEGAHAQLSLQLEKSEDLVTWTNAGDAVTWSIPVDQDKQFIRVRSTK